MSLFSVRQKLFSNQALDAVGSLAARLPQLASPSFHVMGLRIAGAGIALAAQVFASRVMGAEEFGRYALVLVYLLLLGHFGTFGTAQLLCRLLADYLERGEQGRARGLLIFALAFTAAVSSIVIAAAAALIYSPLSPLEPGYVVLASLALAGIPLLALQDFLEAIARGLDRPNLGIGPAYLLRHLIIIIGLSALAALGLGADANTVMALTVLGLILSVAIQFALLKVHLRAALGDARPIYSIHQWTKTALPIASIDVAEVLFANADILILGFFAPPEAVALYFAASRIAQILAYVPYGVTAVTAQKYAKLAATNELEKLQSLIRRSALLSTTVSAAGAVLLLLAGGLLLNLFGSDYGQAHYLVPVLCSGIVIACLLGPGEDVLTMLGKERLCSLAFLLALVVNMGVAVSLVPLLGPLGAALGLVAGLTVRGILLAWFAQSQLGLVLPVFGQIRPRGGEL
ncbi:lipopolysaccharide biosynthesis protein [Devosia submarina]|uniref:lipopolysaccharide biosynthesis protein n=1 Tax=Devosia submarina TaxID=1173082 RepID=UPI000D3BBCA0|nr:lipopolysaccharide biosynthesis protein [Devosia submarina]